MKDETENVGIHTSSFILPLSSFDPVPVVERRPRERAKLEVQVRFLAGALSSPRKCEGQHGTLSRC